MKVDGQQLLFQLPHNTGIPILHFIFLWTGRQGRCLPASDADKDGAQPPAHCLFGKLGPVPHSSSHDQLPAGGVWTGAVCHLWVPLCLLVSV